MRFLDICLVTEIRDAYEVISIVEQEKVNFLDDSVVIFREMLGVAIMKKNLGHCSITIKNPLGKLVTNYTVFYESAGVTCDDDIYELFRKYLNSEEFMDNNYKKFDIFKQQLENS